MVAPTGREPLPAQDAARRVLSLDWLSSHVDALMWVESSPDTGRDALMSWSRTGGRRLIRTGVRNGLHAYGARPYVATGAGTVATLESNGQLWHLETATQLTDSPFPHGDLSADGSGKVCCVRETPDGDELLVIDLATAAVEVVRRGPFLAAPQLRGDRLAWTQWSDEVMPWDSADVLIGRYRPGAGVDQVRHVAGGPHEAAHQPQWDSDGNLYLLSDRTGWWNLYRANPAGKVEAVAPMLAECGAALWESGYASHTALPDGGRAVIAQNGPLHRIERVAPDGTSTAMPSLFTSIKPFLAATSEGLAVVGGAPDQPPQVALLRMDGSGEVDIVRAAPSPPAGPAPEVITVDSGGESITVIVHPGANGAPGPLIVRPHPGPTHHSELRWNGEVAYFTGRGFTVADVDYRGSTGYGRAFRTMLNGEWGVADVQDCIAAARHLVASGRARLDAVFISGASAGGYTALRAACIPDSPFALAVARSAIVAPNRWAVTAPRFQRAHAVALAHTVADVEPSHVCRPVMLIHGHDDPIAPIDDVSELAAALGERDMLASFMPLPGVGHGLSGPALAGALERELFTYERHLARCGVS